MKPLSCLSVTHINRIPEPSKNPMIVSTGASSKGQGIDSQCVARIVAFGNERLSGPSVDARYGVIRILCLVLIAAALGLSLSCASWMGGRGDIDAVADAFGRGAVEGSARPGGAGFSS